MRQVDVLIVGSGPAGMSTALHLVALNPGWARRMVVVDAAVHPRKKLCGGGVTRFGAEILANLGLEFEPPHVPVHEIRIIFEGRTLRFREAQALRVARRDEFDHWLVLRGEEHGIEVRQGEAVIDIAEREEWIDVVTARETFRTRVLVAADGSTSFVKRRLRWSDRPRMARLLEVLTPEDAQERFEFTDGVAVFDFSPMMDGLQGYYWDFPSRIDGAPHMNRGVYDSRVRAELPRAPLKATLADRLTRRGRVLSDHEIEGHPIHWFDPRAELSRPHVLLVGDAAGVDPMFGEGISFALGYGEVAAAEIDDAFRRNTFDFADYRRHVLAHPLLRRLRWRSIGARVLYGLPQHPRAARLVWAASERFAWAVFAWTGLLRFPTRWPRWRSARRARPDGAVRARKRSTGRRRDGPDPRA